MDATRGLAGRPGSPPGRISWGVTLTLSILAGTVVPTQHPAHAQATGVTGGFLELTDVFFAEGDRVFAAAAVSMSRVEMNAPEARRLVGPSRGPPCTAAERVAPPHPWFLREPRTIGGVFAFRRLCGTAPAPGMRLARQVPHGHGHALTDRRREFAALQEDQASAGVAAHTGFAREASDRREPERLQ